jgi:hypothetical protein
VPVFLRVEASRCLGYSRRHAQETIGVLLVKTLRYGAPIIMHSCGNMVQAVNVRPVGIHLTGAANHVML